MACAVAKPFSAEASRCRIALVEIPRRVIHFNHTEAIQGDSGSFALRKGEQVGMEVSLVIEKVAAVRLAIFQRKGSKGA